MFQPSTALRGPSLVGILAALWGLMKRPAFEAAVPTHRGVSYGDGPHRLADVYLPERRGPNPGVLLVHGGGFVIGHRAMKPVSFLATRLVNTGFAVASIDYRLVFRGGRIAASVEDVDRAIAWWVGTAREYRVDERRISVMGLSAGACLALLAAENHPDRLANVVSWFGVYDLAALRGCLGRVVHHFLLRDEEAREWSPIHRIGKLRTPVTLLHGTADRVVDYGQAKGYADARTAAGLQAELHGYEGLPHGFLADARDPMALASVEMVIAALRDPAPRV